MHSPAVLTNSPNRETGRAERVGNETPHDSSTPSNPREDKTSLQLADGELAQREAITILQRVRSQLDSAIEELSDYGKKREAPLEGLERERQSN